tara:strand:+ start:254 stop:742 length:489 start_codon:yes stop_codon:yes gene_type:complete
MASTLEEVKKDKQFTRQETPLNPYDGWDDWDKQLQHLALGWTNRGEAPTPGSDWRKALRNIFGNASRNQWETLSEEYGSRPREMKGVDPSLYYNPDHFFSSFEKLMSPEQFQVFYEKWKPYIYKAHGKLQKQISQGLTPNRSFTTLHGNREEKNPWLTLFPD